LGGVFKFVAARGEEKKKPTKNPNHPSGSVE
jgi:hypothetical protein